MSDPAALLEALANQEHDRWARWMLYLFSKGHFQENGTFIIPAPLVDRWRRQTETPYMLLTEAEKESDRKEARLTLQLIGDLS